MVSIPVAAKKPSTRTYHGDEVIDDYAWLENPYDQEVLQFLEENNAYTEQQLADLKPLQEKIFHEIKDRNKETDMSVPVRDGKWWFYSRTQKGKNYSLFYRLEETDLDNWLPPVVEPDKPIDGEEILLDINALAEGHDFFSIGTFSLSDDGQLLAYSTDTTGNERYNLVIKNLSTGQLLADRIENISSGGLFSLDGSHFYYQRVDDAWRPDSVWRHTLGTDSSADERIFYEPNERFWVGLRQSRTKKFLLLSSESKTTSEVYLINAADNQAPPELVWAREEGIEYAVEHAVVDGKDYLFIINNRDGAENFKVDYAPLDDVKNVTTFIPYDSQRRIEAIDAFADSLVLSYRSDALAKISVASLVDVTDLTSLEFTPIHFNEELATVELGSNPEFSSTHLRLSYDSYIEPHEVIDLELSTGNITVLKRQIVLGDYRKDDYKQELVWAKAADGTDIPVSLIYRKDIQLPAPTLLYGYGSYETSLDPFFSIARLSLLDRGIVYATAHIRGGGELGRPWYQHGKLLEKKNTFTDFIDAAHYLIDNGYSCSDLLAAQGGSAGGLLMGAVANAEPTLFKGILAVVPFVDALNTILDPTLPLTATEWDEWGNPIDDPQVYSYMKSYSPYENISAQDYPQILAMTSLNDTRVRYSEPAKWVARLREHTTADNPILLKTEMIAGHGGVSGRYKKWDEIAYEYAWLINLLTH